jgi:cyanate permease
MSEKTKLHSHPASFLLSVYFGFQGVLYLIAVCYNFYQVRTENPEQPRDAILAAVIGLLISISFLVGAFLLRRDNQKGLICVVLALLTIAGQWLIDAPPPGYLLTFFISLIGVTVAWLNLARDDVRNHSLR